MNNIYREILDFFFFFFVQVSFDNIFFFFIRETRPSGKTMRKFNSIDVFLLIFLTKK